MKGILALVLLVAAGASCGGKSEDEKLFEKRRGICNGLVAKGDTVGQASSDFGFTYNNQFGITCDTQFSQPPGSQCASGLLLCKLFWQAVPADRSLCSQVSGGCLYACEAFAPGPASSIADASPICATRFISGQPFPF